MEARIRQLQALLEDAEIVEDARRPTRSSPGRSWRSATRATTTPSATSIGSIEERGGELDVITPGSPLGPGPDGRTVGRHGRRSTSPTGGTLTVEIVEIE